MKMHVINWLREFNIVTVFIRLLLAFVLAGIVGFERERKGHAAGLRTHILVCLGATLTTLTGIFCADLLGFSSDPMRIGAQVVSGIGFIGAGTILVTRGTHVRGLTTAAGLWSTAAIGLAIGTGFYEGAVICTLIITIVISSLRKLDGVLLRRRKGYELYLEIKGTENVNTVLDSVAQLGINTSSADLTPPRSANPCNAGITIDIFSGKKEKLNIENIVENIRKIENVDIVLADL